MKISKIEYENFRNFRDHGIIKCSTDGKVTIIYGKNGDGKTTLHQLFQWILYGRISFNKTTNDRLYNLKFESEQEYGKTFKVMGRIDFEHEKEQYSATRTALYKKGLDDSEKISEEFTLYKMNSDNDWKKVDRPNETIEKFLPSGLSEYFFFDGESMIADLRVKGKDSANKLREALYSMFDLDIIEAAINHIGRTDLKTSVLGKLYLSKGSVTNGGEIAAVKTNIENAQAKIASEREELSKYENERKAKQEIIATISEKIGGTKSKEEYESQRAGLKSRQKIFLENVEMAQTGFGDAVMDMYPRLFVSKSVKDAKEKIHLKVADSKLPTGLQKTLIEYLLQDSVDTCICGNTLCKEEKEHIQEFLNLLPPKSYASLYDDFSNRAESWGYGHDVKKIESYITRVIENTEQAEKCDAEIKALDDQEKKSPDIEQLVIDRQKAEARVLELNELIEEHKTLKKKYEIYLEGQMKSFDALTKKVTDNEDAQKKIDVMSEVLKLFSDRLEKASIDYSKELEKNIQELLNQMLTSKRSVSVSSDFAVRVTDSYKDESKSEGQFAVVSFAYIGGILKMLQSYESLASKEYPLVLDGPFSKLDPDQRQNVVDTIPKFAPQIILFSKDDLNDVFDEKVIGKVWTIVSNDEKNVAHIEEGYLWK